MSAYWDTSALIRAWSRQESPAGTTRPHAAAEFFCVLTGPGLAVVEKGKAVKKFLSPAEAAQAVERTFKKLEFCELSGRETLRHIRESVPANIAGKAIHDWLHCKAAEAARADKIMTLNWRDFGRMTRLVLAAP